MRKIKVLYPYIFDRVFYFILYSFDIEIQKDSV